MSKPPVGCRVYFMVIEFVPESADLRCEPAPVSNDVNPLRNHARQRRTQLNVNGKETALVARPDYCRAAIQRLGSSAGAWLVVIAGNQ